MKLWFNTWLSMACVVMVAGITAANAQQESTNTDYGDWMVACDEKAPPTKKCAMWQVASTADDAPRLLHVEISFERPFAGAELLVILPLGIHLPNNPSLYIDQTKAMDFEVQHCLADGCYTRIKMTPQLLEQFLHMNGAILRFKTANEQAIELPISGTGSRAAFNSTEVE